MKTGIVIVNFNDALQTLQCVNQISAYHVLDHICIVDNGSNDDSLKILRRIKKREVHLIALENNGGYASGNNAGLRYLQEQNCDLFIVANPDIEIEQIALQDFIAFTKTYPEYGIFGPIIKEGKQINRGWKLPTLTMDILDNLVYINRFFKKFRAYRDSHYHTTLSKVDCISGCFFGITKKALETIGYLDEGTFLYYEENILAKKMRDHGLQTCIVNSVEVVHQHSVTIDKYNNRYKKMRYLKDSQYYYHKQYFKHNRIGMFVLKMTAAFTCFVARKRTKKNVLQQHAGNKKKITILSLHLRVGGIEKAICSLANMLVDTYDVEIVNVYQWGEPAFDLDKRVVVRYLLSNVTPNREEFKAAVKKKNIKQVLIEGYHAFQVLYQKHKRIRQEAKVCNGDIIISTTLVFNRYFSKYQESKVKVAWEHCHPDRKANYSKKVCRKVKKFDVFIPASKQLFDFYKERVTGPKCIYVPLAIDKMPEEVAPLHTQEIAVMGRLAAEKGYDDMLSVLHIMVQQNPNVLLHIMGEGEEKERLEKIIDELQLHKHVVFHGNVVGAKKDAIFMRCSAFVTTSHYESFGLVLIEAMSYGIPCVSFSSAKGSLEIIEHGKNGYIIEDRNQQEMADCLSGLLHKTTKTMQNNALKKARQYTFRRVKKQWLHTFTLFTQGDIKKRVIFTSSAGGHFSELFELEPLMEQYNSFLLTEDHEMMQTYKQSNRARSWYLRPGTKEHRIKFLCDFPFNIAKSFRVYWKVKPDVVIATGAHTTVPICYIAKLFGKKVIFIETFASISTKTLSGKLVYPIADLFLVQWEEMLKLYPKAIYRGGLK